MKRFSTQLEIIADAQIELGPDESKHAVKVLRLEQGDEVLLSNGRGIEALAKILSVHKTSVILHVEKITKVESARRRRVEIVQALLKGPRMDWLIEKATELAVDAIHPVTSQFSVAASKDDRWQRIAQAAMKQSGNIRLPEISSCQNLLTCAEKLPSDSLKIILSPSAPQSLWQTIQNHSGNTPIYLALGPEGGFSDAEENQLVQQGFIPAKLAKNILRGETAAIAALAIALHAIDF